MKKVGFVLGAVVMNLAIFATTALAQSTLPNPDDGNVKGEVVTPPGGTAFTGTDVMMIAAVALVLLAIGIAFFVIGRRRSASTA
jgi:hypothetical protein